MDAMWFQQALDRAGATQADLARHLRLNDRALAQIFPGFVAKRSSLDQIVM